LGGWRWYALALLTQALAALLQAFISLRSMRLIIIRQVL
jgi:hypothetical protein